jgi:hypothetical protein
MDTAAPPDQAAGFMGPGLRRDDGGGGVDDRWSTALALYARAEGELEALAQTQDDDVYGRALGRHSAALAKLLSAPAPDLAAAAGKLQLIVRHQVFELRFGEACFAALARDLRRLAAR